MDGIICQVSSTGCGRLGREDDDANGPQPAATTAVPAIKARRVSIYLFPTASLGDMGLRCASFRATRKVLSLASPLDMPLT